MRDDVQTPVSQNHPMRIAWESYKKSGDYANSAHWAAYKEHVAGSLWAAFVEGYRAAKLTDEASK
jgi:hypothetical protein